MSSCFLKGDKSATLKSENIIGLDPCILNRFSLFGPRLDCLVEIGNYSRLSLAFIASSFWVTEENVLFETVQYGPTPFFRIFSLLLEELNYIFLFDRT